MKLINFFNFTPLNDLIDQIGAERNRVETDSDFINEIEINKQEDGDKAKGDF